MQDLLFRHAFGVMENVKRHAVTAIVLHRAAEIQPLFLHDKHCRITDTHENMHTNTFDAPTETLTGANMLGTDLEWTQQITGWSSHFILNRHRW